jgi:hypothetical protein
MTPRALGALPLFSGEKTSSCKCRWMIGSSIDGFLQHSIDVGYRGKARHDLLNANH